MTSLTKKLTLALVLTTGLSAVFASATNAQEKKKAPTTTAAFEALLAGGTLNGAPSINGWFKTQDEGGIRFHLINGRLSDAGSEAAVSYTPKDGGKMWFTNGVCTHVNYGTYEAWLTGGKVITVRNGSETYPHDNSVQAAPATPVSAPGK